ncbi:MAG: YolD-like family protein, partial [Clostridiales bacterium]|nr:YolD-like family protein [Clostridiales bacterium]
PFAAVRGHSERMSVEVEKLLRVPKLELSEDEAEKLSDKLAKIKKGMDITVTHFLADGADSSLGYYVRTSGKIVEMDAIFQKLKIADEDNNAISTVRFYDVVDVTLWGNLHIYEK